MPPAWVADAAMSTALETEAGQMAVLGIRPGGRIELDEDVSD